MAFTVPTFNLPVDVYTGPWLSKSLRLSTTGNLSMGRRVQQQWQDDEVIQQVVGTLQVGLMLPALTDVRDAYQNSAEDVVEVPAGSGRWYSVITFDDVAKGFSNEYRFALMGKIGEAADPVRYAGCVWPVPCP